MTWNFIECCREQPFLLPPDVRDWLPANHMVWLVLDAVAGMDLSDFYAAYRRDGLGRPAYDPAMMVALVLYSYARTERSSRAIERKCLEDIAYRVIAMNERPDHSTIARFVVRHEEALAGVFSAVLKVCAQAGVVKPDVIAVDGCRLPAAVCDHHERMVDFEQIAREIIAAAKQTDAQEDELYGERRGDELPPELSTPEGRKTWLAEQMGKLADEQQQAVDVDNGEATAGGDSEFKFVAVESLLTATNQGRRGWLREARRQLDAHRVQHPRPIPRSRLGRLVEAARQLDEEHDAERQASDAYEAYRARGRMKDGRRFGGPPKPYQPPPLPAGQINITDPDARRLKVTRGFVQGYNAQLVTTKDQYIIAAEVNVDTADFGHLKPMVNAARSELEQAGVRVKPEVALADAGYWNHEHMDSLAADGIAALIPPDAADRKGSRPGWEGGRYSWMRNLLSSELGAGLYQCRQWMIEAVFGQTKHTRGIDQFRRRGRPAVRTELRLIAASHNITKLHRHQTALATG